MNGHEPLDATREQLLRAAVDLFSVTGFTCPPVTAVARHASVPPLDVFRMFPSKRDLIAATVSYCYEVIHAELVRRTGCPSSPCSTEPLPVLIAAYQQMQDNTHLLLLQHDNAAFDDARIHDAHHTGMTCVTQLVLAHSRDDITAGHEFIRSIRPQHSNGPRAT